MDNAPVILDRPKAAKFLGEISLRKLDMLADEKQFERVHIGRRVFFRVVELEKFLRKGTK